jgi:prepilin-type N-terminal cleavage/methylation domain-containing protein
MKANSEKGFSLLEMLISVVILLITSGAAFYALAYYQRSYGSSQLRADMHMGVRAALELMAQEVNQAGLLPSFGPPFGPPRQLAAAVSPCPSPCPSPPPVQVTSVNSIFVNEKLTIDTGSNQEDVTVTNVNTATSEITAVFSKAHPANAPVNAFGLFPQGIRSTAPNPSSSTLLKIFGDINGDNTITYVEYDCSGSTLTRSEWQILSSGATNTRVPVRSGDLVKDLIANPCFQYTTASAGGFTFVTSVTVTLSVQTSDKDPFTKQRVSMTKSSLNLAPRNLLTGMDLAQAGFTGRLQLIPPTSPPL